jgi:hypothetical protein
LLHVQQGAQKPAKAAVSSLTCIHAHNGDAATLACAADELIQDVSRVILEGELWGKDTNAAATEANKS